MRLAFSQGTDEPTALVISDCSALVRNPKIVCYQLLREESEGKADTPYIFRVKGSQKFPKAKRVRFQRVF